MMPITFATPSAAFLRRREAINTGGKRKRSNAMNEDQMNKSDGNALSTAGTAAKPTFVQLMVEFLQFKRSLIPYTLHVLLAVFVLVGWYYSIAGLFGEGGLAGFFGTTYEGMKFAEAAKLIAIRTIGCLGFFLAWPFVVHYVLAALRYVFLSVVRPLWEKLVIGFCVNVLPDFATDRFMKSVDVAIAGFSVVFMSAAAVLKGVLWLPKTLCQALGAVANKDEK